MTTESGADRRYPSRLVGVGAAILVTPRDRAVGDMPADVRSRGAWCWSSVAMSRWPATGAFRAGVLEVGEWLAAGVAREVLEETGLVVHSGGVIEVFDRMHVTRLKGCGITTCSSTICAGQRAAALTRRQTSRTSRSWSRRGPGRYGVTPLIEVVARAVHLAEGG